MEARVVAKEGVVVAVQRDGVRVAELHGRVPPSGGGTGSRIVASVELPLGAVEVQGVLPPGTLLVQGVHGREGAWAYLSHRLVVVGSGGIVVLAASPWADGAWAGDSAVSTLADVVRAGLPPTANPA